MSDAIGLTEEIIVSLAPDATSVKAAKKLVQDGAFSETRRSPDGRWTLARCRGSLPQPYLVKAEMTGGEVRFTCECGSMKYPCKHALGLLYLAAQQPAVFAETTAIIRESPLLSESLPLAVPTSGPTDPPKDEGEALWQAIFAEPEDPAPRLIYADWIDEHGDPELAQFIRVECEIERSSDGDRLRALRKQERDLLARHRTEWMADVPKHLRGKVGMRGGFVGHLDLPVKALLSHGPRLFETFPIFSVRLAGAYPKQQTGRLAVEPFWARVRRLELYDLTGGVLETILSSVFLNGVTWLELGGNAVGSRGCAALGRWPTLKGLTTLGLNNAGITDGALAALCDAGPAALSELGLMSNGIGNAGAESLAACGALAGLRRLSLGMNQIGPKGARALASSPSLAGLRELNLRDNPLTDQGAKALAESPHLGGLATLRLTGVELSAKAAAALRERFGDRVTFA